MKSGHGELEPRIPLDQRGWCARAWLLGGAHPLPSNIVCWPAR